MRIYATFGQLITGLKNLSVHNLDSGTVRNQIGLGISGFIVSYCNLTLLLCILDSYNAAKLSDNGKTLWLTGLKKLLNSRKTLCNIAAGNAARMESTHGKLCTGLTDGLCRDDSDCLTNLYRLAGCHVGSIALSAHTDMGLTA